MGILVAKYSDFSFLIRPQSKVSYPTARTSQGPVEPPSPSIVAENERLKAKLDVALEQAKETELEAHIRTLQEGNDRLAAQSARRESEYSEMQHQLSQLRTEKEELRTASLVEEGELANLRTQVGRLNKEIERQASTKTTNAPCQSLNARNLHVVDVHDAEGDGTISRAFGRVFYVEGKCLTFYAFDLPDRALNKTFSFYVWGAKGDAKPIRKLGIFHRDDPRDGRWLLTLDDPAVLGQINNVFVTMEPDAVAANGPKGKTILRAYLGNNAKHP
jgi:cell division protein FtsB